MARVYIWNLQHKRYIFDCECSSLTDTRRSDNDRFNINATISFLAVWFVLLRNILISIFVVTKITIVLPMKAKIPERRWNDWFPFFLIRLFYNLTDGRDRRRDSFVFNHRSFVWKCAVDALRLTLVRWTRAVCHSITNLKKRIMNGFQ